MNETRIKEKALPLKVKVRAVPRDCQGCVMRGPERCPLCCSLVVDEGGQVYVSVRPVNGNGDWQTIGIEDLTAPPKMLLVDVD